MLKHISRFDYTKFAWLLPLEIHLIIADYCQTGVELKTFCTQAVEEDVCNVDVSRNGELLLAGNTKWRDLEFGKPINATQDDCAGYYVVQVYDEIIVLHSDFTIYVRIDIDATACALCKHCQKVVFTAGFQIYELEYMAPVPVKQFKYTATEDRYLTILECQRSGNIVMCNDLFLYLMSPDYKRLHFTDLDNIQWLGTDVWDQIVAATPDALYVFSADLKSQLTRYDWEVTNGLANQWSGAINMGDGTLYFLDSEKHELLVFK